MHQLVKQLDYGALRTKHPKLIGLNQAGTCMAMSCYWCKRLLTSPQTPASDIINDLEKYVMILASNHRNHLDRLSTAVGNKAKCEAYETTYNHFNLSCADVRGANPRPIGVSRIPDKEIGEDQATWAAASWAPHQPGQIWKVIYDFLADGKNSNAAFLLHLYDGQQKSTCQKGHAIAVYVTDGGVGKFRIFDMNDGEHMTHGRTGWESFHNTLDNGINFVDVHPITSC